MSEVLLVIGAIALTLAFLGAIPFARMILEEKGIERLQKERLAQKRREITP